MNPDSPQSGPVDAKTEEAELMILPDGRILAHNLTVPLHRLLAELSADPIDPNSQPGSPADGSTPNLPS